jgi:hypothetical protein
VRAHNLKELQDRVQGIEPGCLYYHFWGGLLRPRFDDPEYRNDFAIWVRNEVHDEELAERLASVDPTQHETLEGLREAVAEAIESRLEVMEAPPGSARRVRSTSCARRSRCSIPGSCSTSPRSSRVPAAPQPRQHLLSLHRRAPRACPSTSTTFACGSSTGAHRYADLCDRLAEVDYYFVSLADLRKELAQILGEYFEIPPRTRKRGGSMSLLEQYAARGRSGSRRPADAARIQGEGLPASCT